MLYNLLLKIEVVLLLKILKFNLALIDPSLLRYFRLLIGNRAWTLSLKLNHLEKKIIVQEGQCLTKTLLFEVKTMSNENL
jgi:hypothetical protein